MKTLLEKLGISINHLLCLDSVFYENHAEYKRIDDEIFNSEAFRDVYKEISRELYAGGKTSGNATLKLNRQMILGDIIEYIFSGRAYYFAADNEENFNNFLKLILYCVNQLLIFDIITVNQELRKKYIEKLEENISLEILYEKNGDRELSNTLKESNVKIWGEDWTKQIDQFVDSILPKTLGCPKELVVFGELLRLKKWIVIPLLLIQRIFDDKEPIAPPDFLILNKNKDIYGLEVGYKKEIQSREFSIRSSIPTFAVDLKNHMHNRCPKCGENILYCDRVINEYCAGTLIEHLTEINGVKRYKCFACPQFNNGNCPKSNYYGFVSGVTFFGKEIEKTHMHFHSKCILNDTYPFRRQNRIIKDYHSEEFFAQIPEIEGIENL
jgi:hypothetical protein